MAKRADGLRKWALMGAEQRLAELASEITAIHNAFPELRRGRRGGHVSTEGSGSATPGRRRRRRKLSAEARKRISDAQKARWAKHRRQAKKAQKK